MNASKLGEKAQFLPKKVYKDKLTLGSGKIQINLFYFSPGHTNGDAWVVFPALRILQTGDMVAWKDTALLLRPQQRRQLHGVSDAGQRRRRRRGRRQRRSMAIRSRWPTSSTSTT